MEQELEQLLLHCRDTPEKERDFSPLYKFFTKVIQKDQRIKITDRISPLISLLSTADGGLLWPIAKDVLDGYKPYMIVPPLYVKDGSYSPRKPKRLILANNTLVIPKSLSSPISPLSTRTKTFVKSLTDRDILPKLVFSPEKTLFHCKPKASTPRGPSSLSYTISRKTNEMSTPFENTRTLSLHGMVKIAPDRTGEFIPLNKFLNFKERTYMTQQIPFFQNWARNKAFVKWYYTFRMRRYHHTLDKLLAIPPFESKTFTEVYIHLRQTIDTVFKTCHLISKELPSDNFTALTQNSTQSLEDMRRQIETLNETLKNKLEHFFEQIRGIAFLLRSDYEVLKKIGALPKSLIQYSLEKETSSPSITGIRNRNKILLQERTLSHLRKEYIPRFFNMVRLFLRDFNGKQVNTTLNELYNRFTEPGSNHMITLSLDREIGIKMEPSAAEFIEWFENVDMKIWSIFLTYQLELSSEATNLIFEDQPIPEIRIEKEFLMTEEISSKREKCLQIIKEAFESFEKRLIVPREFFLQTIERIDEVKGNFVYTTIDEFTKLMKEFKECSEKIDQLTRLFTCGALYTDMKLAKMQLKQMLQVAMEYAKGVGINKANEIYELILENRQKIINEEQNQKVSLLPPDPKFKKEIFTQIQSLATEFMIIVQILAANYGDGLISLMEKNELVKEIFGQAQNALKKKKVKRRVPRKQKEEATEEK